MIFTLTYTVRAFALLLIGISCQLALAQDTYTAATDRAALAALYNATGGDNWNRNANWLSDKSLDQWQGVSVNSDGRVNGLSISNNNMNGSLPSDLGNLSEMDAMMIYSSSLSGSLPSSLGNLSKMRLLILTGNNLSGSIPTSFGNLDALLYMGLEQNNLSGSVPSELGSLDNLQYLLLSGNSLSGCIPAALSGVTMDPHGLPFCSAATATDTTTPPATATPLPPSDTPVPTNTLAPPTNTPVPTNTPAPPTDTPVPTNTPAPPTDTPVPTNTPAPPTDTPVPTNAIATATDAPDPRQARAISNVTLDSSQAGTLGVSWDAPVEAPSDYRVNWAKVGESFPRINTGLGNAFPTSASYTITGLDGGERYKVRVRARYDSGRNGAWSAATEADVAS